MSRPGRHLAVTTPLLLLLALAGGCGDSAGPGGSGGGQAAGASCVAPYLDDQPPTGDAEPAAPAPTVHPGDSLRVYGHWFTSTCNDTGGHDPYEPLPPVHLTVTFPGGATQDLGEASPAGSDMGFSEVVRVPDGTPDGTATVRGDGELPTTYRFPVAAAGS